MRRETHRNLQLRGHQLEHRREERREELPEQRPEQLREQRAKQGRIEVENKVKVQAEIQEKTHVPTQATTQLKARPSLLRDEQRAVLRETHVRTRADVHREVNRAIRPMPRQVVAAATGGIVPARTILSQTVRPDALQ